MIKGDRIPHEEEKLQKKKEGYAVCHTCSHVTNCGCEYTNNQPIRL